jgi:hypothetical protein
MDREGEGDCFGVVLLFLVMQVSQHFAVLQTALLAINLLHIYVSENIFVLATDSDIIFSHRSLGILVNKN